MTDMVSPNTGFEGTEMELSRVTSVENGSVHSGRWKLQGFLL